MNQRHDDTALGMDRSMVRRDFLNGAAVAIGAFGVGAGNCARGAEARAWPTVCFPVEAKWSGTAGLGAIENDQVWPIPILSFHPC
jgi:hypothetical protein